MKQTIIHPRIKLNLEAVINQPPNSFALIGTNGIGKTELSQWLIRQISGKEKLDIKQNPIVKFITTENNNSISTEQIKSIKDFTKLKTVGKSSLRRFIIIEHADQMTIVAQNALLKLLEEPSIDTMIILTIDNTEAMLPTVMSRLQYLTIFPPTKNQLKDYFEISTADFDRYYLLSGGLPGLIQAIIDDSKHPLVTALASVRELLGTNTYGRLLKVNQLSSEKSDVKPLLDILIRTAKVSIDQAALKENIKSIDNWTKILSSAVKAKEALNKNANTKLVLTDLFLNLV